MDTNSLILILKGRPASKKNSKQMFRNSRTGKMFTSSSKAFKRFQNDALSQILHDVYRATYAGWNSAGLFDICYVFYQKGKLSQDADNAMATINDVLQQALVIEDDKNILSGSFSIVRGAPDWKTEIVITRLEGGEQT